VGVVRFTFYVLHLTRRFVRVHSMMLWDWIAPTAGVPGSHHPLIFVACTSEQIPFAYTVRSIHAVAILQGGGDARAALHNQPIHSGVSG
jgi:hypothetical protein